MKTAPPELPRNHKKPLKPAPIWIDGSSDCQSIVVNAPVAEVYCRCLKFEEFPRFISSIKKMEKINETRFACKSIINGQEVETVVTIMMRVPERRIAWQSVSDNLRVGVVSFVPLSRGATKVTVKVRSVLEPTLLRSYLTNFKRFVEQEAAT